MPDMDGQVGSSEVVDVKIEIQNAQDGAIDVLSLENIPQHGSNIESLIERYGNDPQRCPFIRSMGDAGIQLVERLAEAQKDPNRGPTVGELLEARRNRDKASQSTDQKAERQTTIREHIHQEFKAAGIADTTEPVHKPLADSANIAYLYEKNLRPVAEIINVSNSRPVETAISEPAVSQPTERQPQIKNDPLQVLKPITFDNIETGKHETKKQQFQNPRIKPVSRQTTAGTKKAAKFIKSVELPEAHLKPETELTQGSKNPKTQSLKPLKRERSQDLSKMEQLDINISAEIESLVTNLYVNESPIDNELPLATELTTPIIDRLTEEAEPFEGLTVEPEEYLDKIQPELDKLIASLDPAQDEAALETLGQMVELLRIGETRAKDLETNFQEIELLLDKLIISLGAEKDNKVIIRLLQILLGNNQPDGTKSLSIEQRNRLGTFEYKTTFGILTSRLIQLLSQKLQVQSLLGKYILRISSSKFQLGRA